MDFLLICFSFTSSN